ncbi:MAG: recombinase A [Myxococcales bacterium]|nr:recombinase A [Myxococcales bacterium]
MTAPALRLLPSAPATPAAPAPEPLYAQITPGRLVELSAAPHGPSVRTSTAVALLRRVQREGETAAWIQLAGGSLFPPDLHDAGIDLQALVVVHVPEDEGSAGLGRAAELLLRSEAFGLVVVDLGSLPCRTAWHGRLLGLARQHESRVLLLTDKPAHADSLGPLVGLRVQSVREARPDGGFCVEHQVLKNKAGVPVAPAEDRFVGPPGLR